MVYWLMITVVGPPVLLVLFILGCYLWVKWRARSRVFSDPGAVPFRETALVLGTARFTSSGGDNQFFSGRIAAAARLFKQGATQNLLVSGADKLPVAVTEPQWMHAALLGWGVPAERLIQDPHGYRTWDSMWICLHEFGCPDPVVISQRFHVERAVFIGLHMHMQPVGFTAEKVKGWIGIRMFVRECLARVKCILDCFWLHPLPVYLRKKMRRPVSN